MSGSLLLLVLAPSASAVATIDMGSAQTFSVLATTLTSNGATAMSDDLGVSPGATYAGDTAPIVLGTKHLGDSAASAAMASFETAYGDAVVRPNAQPLPPDLAGATLTAGVYNAPAAEGFTAGGVLTLDGQGDANAVFILQIGAALNVGAGAQVRLAGQAQACNVFWAVGGAAVLGATVTFTGTLLAPGGAVSLGAGTRVDGRLFGKGAVTLASSAIRTACTPTVYVAGPAGPAGPTGATGTTGATGPAGPDGATGAAGPAGADGATGAPGPAGAAGATGLVGGQGVVGSAGANGADGASGADGVDGVAGLMGPMGPTGADGLVGLMGSMGPAGLAGVTGAQGPPGAVGASGSAGVPGPAGATTSLPDGTSTSTTAAAGSGVPVVVPGVATSRLCVTKRPDRSSVRAGGVVRWTIVVTNCGRRLATGVVVTDRDGAGATYLTRGGGRASGGVLRWVAGALVSGESRTYRVTSRLSPRARAGQRLTSITADGINTAPKVGYGRITVDPRTRARSAGVGNAWSASLRG